MRGMCYEDRLKALSLPSLEYRRLRGDMIETYKITHAHYDPITTYSLITLIPNSNTRSHRYKISKPRVNTNLFLQFFTNRIINKWNGLPAEVVEAKTLNCFKNKIDFYYKDFKYVVGFNVD